MYLIGECCTWFYVHYHNTFSSVFCRQYNWRKQITIGSSDCQWNNLLLYHHTTTHWDVSCACVNSMSFLWTFRGIIMTTCTIVKSACIVNWSKLYKIIETLWLWGGKHSFISLQQTVPVHKWHKLCTALGRCNSSWSGVCYYRMPNYNILASYLYLMWQVDLKYPMMMYRPNNFHHCVTGGANIHMETK